MIPGLKDFGKDAVFLFELFNSQVEMPDFAKTADDEVCS